MEREGSAEQRLAVPPLFKRAHDMIMMQPRVQLAARNNAAQVALVQQHVTMARLLLLLLQHTCAVVTCSGINARTARNASTASTPPQHSAAACRKVMLSLHNAPCSPVPAYMLETALSMRAWRSLGCQEADGRGAMPSFQHCLLRWAE
jgi:hypothetical protein